MKYGAETLINKLGLTIGIDPVTDALTGLLGNGKRGVDIGQLVSKFSSDGNLSSSVNSWLGDDNNQSISVGDVVTVLGEENVNTFGKALGIDRQSAALGLSSAVPAMIDRASNNGDLLGQAGGIINAAKRFF